MSKPYPDASAVGARTLSLFYFLRLFVGVRWVAGIGALLLIAFLQFVPRLSFPYAWLYAVAASILVYNAIFHFVLRHSEGLGKPGVLEEAREEGRKQGIAFAQINLDLVALFWLLHFSGGLENPFLLFFLFHVVISGILLAPALAAFEAGFVSVLVLLLGGLEKLGLLAHYHPTLLLGSAEPMESALFVLGLPTILIITVLALSAFTIVIMSELNRRSDESIALSIELKHRNRRLMRVDEMRRGLLAVASHDLKSPIAAVGSYLMALRENYLGPLNEKQLGVVEKCLSRLTGLNNFISDVLSWTAIERGMPPQDMEIIDLAPILREVVNDYLDRSERKGIRIRLEIAEPLPKIEAAPVRMTHVLENLLSNALKYTPEGGRIEVRAAGEPGGLLLTVKDTGIGISREDREHLFEDFFRANSVKKTYEGTGLGLSAVRSIVTAHKGRVWVESELGKGSSFTVQLPALPTDDPKRSIPASPATGTRDRLPAG